MASQKGLGKGLGALLGDFDEGSQEENGLKKLPLHKIEPNPDQPRRDFDPEELEELAESIRTHGVIQPLTVREMPNGYYQIIAGERRWRASRLAGLEEIPAVIIEADDKNALRLLSLCEGVLDKVRSGELTAGHARAILQLKSEKKQLEAAQKISALGLSVRQAEMLCKNMTREPEKQPPIVLEVNYVAECEKNLSKHLGRGVKIVNGKRKGHFELEFYGQDDLQVLLDALMKIQK